MLFREKQLQEAMAQYDRARYDREWFETAIAEPIRRETGSYGDEIRAERVRLAIAEDNAWQRVLYEDAEEGRAQRKWAASQYGD